MATEQIDTVIGAHVQLTGSLKNQGTIHIHGTVTGDVSSEALVIIGETAVVHGPITARQVDVSGQVHGSITASEQIELQPKSLVKGDLTTNRLSIRPGAMFIGKSNMGEDSPSEDGAKKKPRLELE
jgi:cytoskeletal protein CcmA (bactofilin family)